MIYIDEKNNEVDRFLDLIGKYSKSLNIDTVVINSIDLKLIKKISTTSLRLIVSPVNKDIKDINNLLDYCNKNKIKFCLVSKSLYQKSDLDNRDIFIKQILFNTLNMLDEEVKTLVLSSSIALENKFIDYGEKVIALDEINGNLTTMVVLIPNYKNNIIHTKIVEIIAKPLKRS